MRFLNKVFRGHSTEVNSPSKLMTPDHEKKWPLIFVSGSKTPGADAWELDRFREICGAIGEMLAMHGYGIVGCPPHVERVLASQSARIGLHRINPTAVFSAAGLPENRLYAQDRIRLVNRASAAIFIGGSQGTLEEYETCRRHHVEPLVPVAGARGAGAELAARLRLNNADFWSKHVDPAVSSILWGLDREPAAYADAVLAVLSAYSLQPKVPPAGE
jgi:hypothetical protein